MCKESPGPRCSGHVAQELAKLHEESKDVFAAHQSARQEMVEATEVARTYREEVGENTDPEIIQQNITAMKTASEKMAATSEDDRKIREKIRSKETELDSTAGGIQSLKETIYQLEAKGEYAEELNERLRVGSEAYEDKIRRYDAEHKTVNMRKPSLDGNDEGIDRLSAERKELEKKFSKARKELLENKDPSQDVRLQRRLDNYGKKIESNKNQFSHAVATDKLIKQGVLGDPRKVAELRAAAAKAEQQRQESYDRSDTDGFMSQWASGLAAQESLMKAELEENAGKAEFVALFDKDGNMVPAKLISTKFGPAWAVYSDPNDSSSKFTGEFINESKSDNPKTQAAALARKGYTLGRVKAPAHVAMSGSNTASVRPSIFRSGKDIFNECEVITKNVYEEKEEDQK
jgi:chromosome segregation ATPase